ncbi:hypothetical protein FQN50_001215 [Emmonsiellopsis sp. PD_5]|nr:hypothetical protein FQN50_001215 [Emmonsiellopsis sp. PD_5]
MLEQLGINPGMRSRRLVVLLGIISLVGLSLMLLGTPVIPHKSFDTSSNPLGKSQPQEKPPVLTEPVSETSHPIAQLFNKANTAFQDVRSKQSKTLKEAVDEYRRRYKMPPPPNFDVWFKLARKRGVEMIDEYDTIYHTILPFWGLEPKLIRERAREAIGFDNALMGLLIRSGKVAKAVGGGESQEWKRTALTDMMASFIKYLPDMDLAFNIHDEPRVVVPSDDLQRLVSRAVDGALPRAFGKPSLQNSWSKRPEDVNKGDRVEEFRTTRFNKFAHQPTWTHSRTSCPADSPARNLDENDTDNIKPYSYTELGFLSNTTAFSDICQTPSLRYTFGFFDRPNALDIVSDLFPIFSQSKVSSYQDILYPSPWYWTGKVTYEADKDRDWDSKTEQMYWRGSTTGGFSRAGGWRRQHRQLLVKNINGWDTTKVYEKGEGNTWSIKEAPRRKFKDLFNVKFSHVGQCDPEDCKAQTEFFDIVEAAGQQDAWAYKHLIDVDGNAFSGRYYAFLLSNSLVYKLAIFREWHDEWIRPWVHFVPFSLKGGEHVETVRYFAKEDEGRSLAKVLAKQGQDWAGQALRNDDLEVWFFRLLLEYGRVVDDNRENIGFTLA